MSRRVVLVRLFLVAGCAVAPVATTQAEMNSSTQGSHTRERKEDQAHRMTIESDRIDRIARDRPLIFIGNVVARQRNWSLYADRIEIYMNETRDRIVTAIAIGSVRITTSDCREGMAGRAEYYEMDQRMVLSGNARVWPPEDVVPGDDIVIYLPQVSSGVTGSCPPAGDEVHPRHPLKGLEPGLVAM